MRALDFRIKEDEILFIEAENGTVGVIQSGRQRTLFMNTPEDEIALFLEPNDLIVISAFMSGEGARRGIMALAYLLLEMENPWWCSPRTIQVQGDSGWLYPQPTP